MEGKQLYTMDDKSLWRQFREGNHHVFEIIYKQYINLLANYGRRICGDDELVKDAIQDVFTDLWRNRDNLGSTDSIEYYLIKAYRRNLNKKVKAARKYVPGKVEYHEFELSPEITLIAAEVEHEKLEQLCARLNALSSRQKEAIFLRFYSGLNYSKISNIMGINPQSAYNIVFRALEILREKMSHNLTSVFIFLFCTLPQF